MEAVPLDQFLKAYKAFLRSRGQALESLKFPLVFGTPADLHRAFSYARNYGGFHGVDQKKRWRDMASNQGTCKMTTSVSSALKTAYDKFLRPFEDWVAEHGLVHDSPSSSGGVLLQPSAGQPPGWPGGGSSSAAVVADPSTTASGGPKSKRGGMRSTSMLHQPGLLRAGSLTQSPIVAAPFSAEQVAQQQQQGQGQQGQGQEQPELQPGGPWGPAGLAMLGGGLAGAAQAVAQQHQQQQQPFGTPGGGEAQQQVVMKRKLAEQGAGMGSAEGVQHVQLLPQQQQQQQQQAWEGAPGLQAVAASNDQLPLSLLLAAQQVKQQPQQQGEARGGADAEAMYAGMLPSAGPILQVPEGLVGEQGERVVGALLCGLPSQESWALNALSLMSFHTTILLGSVPGLADALGQILLRGFAEGAAEGGPHARGDGLLPPLQPMHEQAPLPPWQCWPGASCTQAASAGAAIAHDSALRRWQRIFPNHPQLEYRAQAAAAAAQILYNTAAAAAEGNASHLLTARCLRCWIHVLQAAHDMFNHAPGGAAAVVLRWQCQQPFLQEAAISVLQMLERLAPHITLPASAPAPAQQQQQQQQQREREREPAAKAGAADAPGPEAPKLDGGGGPALAAASAEGQLLSRLQASVVALVAPGRPLLPLQLCCAAVNTLTAWAAAGPANASAVQQCCTADNPQLLRNIIELLSCPFDDIRAQGEERVVEEGGFPEAAGEGVGGPEGEEGNGLREVCIDMATVIMQVRLLASATHLLLRVVSSRAVEVRRSVAVQTRLVKLLAGVAAHDHPGYPLSWQVNPARAAHLTAIKDRMLPLFEHRSIVLKQARMHATTILASLAFDPATRQYILPYEAQILQQVMCARVPADGPMNALLTAFCQQPQQQ